VRWAAFGGDPNNVYANMNEIKIKLTFFDINDSLLCTIAFAIAAVNLFQAVRNDRNLFWKLADWATLFATAACLVLSYRRSAWLGFLLAFLVVMMRFPLRRRVQLLVFGMPAVGAAVLVAAMRRLGQTKGAGQGLGRLFYDMQSGRFGAESERVLELKLALADFVAHPLTGIGSWGRYTGFQHISWQAGEDGGLFVHSGVLHIALKAGLPGLVLLSGTIFAFAAIARRALRTLPPDLLGLATAGAAGLAFMLPDLLAGTPFPQIRTTQMLALCLALPYVALAACREAAAVQPRDLRARGHVHQVPAPA
jgi:O-antigen ligase